MDLLRQSLSEIRRVQSELLARQIDLCARGHKFYRQR